MEPRTGSTDRADQGGELSEEWLDRVWAAIAITSDLRTARALLAGDRVPVENLDPDVLRRLQAWQR
jgi:hypothetical protein